MIDWCLTPTLTVLQLYRGLNKYMYVIMGTKGIHVDVYVIHNRCE